MATTKLRRLLRLKRYEQPPPDYFENFRHEFRRRRDELFRQPRWRICFERARGFTLRLDVRSLASAAAAAVVACAAVISLTIYSQPDTPQLAAQSSPVPSSRPANADRGLHMAPPMFIPRFDTQPAVLSNSRDIRMLPVMPADSPRSGQFVPLKLEWESLDDSVSLEK